MSQFCAMHHTLSYHFDYLGLLLSHAILFIHGKNDFTKGSKILLDIDQKIILLDLENNFVEILKIMSNAAKIFDNLIWAFYIIILIVQQNCFSVSS